MVEILCFIAGVVATILVVGLLRKILAPKISAPLHQETVELQLGFTQEQLDSAVQTAKAEDGMKLSGEWLRVLEEERQKIEKRTESRIWTAKLEERGVAQRQAQMDLDQWKTDFEAEIRADAAVRSTAIQKGKYTEQLAPFLPGFPFNPRDCRFLGDFCDFIVIDGYQDAKLGTGDVRKIVFMEIKTGKSALTKGQKSVKIAIEGKQVEWRTIKI